MYYKYMIFREDFFKNRLIRFTQPECFNDPFEGAISKTDLSRYISKYLPNMQVYAELIKEYGISYGDIGVLALTGNKKNLLMWAHYADEHKGIVVHFDSKHKFFNNDLNVHDGYCKKVYKVTYSKDRCKAGGFFSTKNNPPQMLINKSTEWRYEKEKRMFLKKSDATKILYEYKAKNKTKCSTRKPRNNVIIDSEIWLIDMPKEAIKEISVGARANREKILECYMKNVIMGNLDSRTKLSFMKLSDDNYTLECLRFEDIEIKDKLFEMQGLDFVRLSLNFDLDIEKKYNKYNDDFGDLENFEDIKFYSIEEILEKNFSRKFLDKFNELRL